MQTITIAGAKPHPTKLVQSAAMASVRPPLPSYRPLLPKRLIETGLLSDAQIETVIYAGEAHAELLAGRYSVDESLDNLSLAKDGDENAVQFRKGFFLGDGTGSGKGRQAAGIILDNWLRGRRKAVWISKSDKLIEDAQRDWSALGQEKLLIVPQSRYRQGTPIRIAEGILFTTYATLRSSEREGKSSRLKQILDWLGPDYDGVILFDEAHAMANAAGEKSERGDKAPSQQGRAGLRLQHALPQARIVYISATGATSVHNLAYAQRLGLWGGSDFPFANRADFVAAVEAGGIATMEVLARDLKALGLYIARSLSYEGIEVEIVEHELTSEQIRIYDAYARGVSDHPRQPRSRAQGRQYHGRKRHAERPGESRRQKRLRKQQAALFQSPHHGDEDADAAPVDRRRSRARRRRRGAARLDRRKPDGAPPCRNPG